MIPEEINDRIENLRISMLVLAKHVKDLGEMFFTYREHAEEKILKLEQRIEKLELGG